MFICNDWQRNFGTSSNKKRNEVKQILLEQVPKKTKISLLHLPRNHFQAKKYFSVPNLISKTRVVLFPPQARCDRWAILISCITLENGNGKNIAKQILLKGTSLAKTIRLVCGAWKSPNESSNNPRHMYRQTTCLVILYSRQTKGSLKVLLLREGWTKTEEFLEICQGGHLPLYCKFSLILRLRRCWRFNNIFFV